MEEVRLSRQELYDMVWAKPMTELAKEYNISDVGLRKMCKRLDIPIPLPGHWQKIRAGKEVTRPPMQGAFEGEEYIVLNRLAAGEDRPVTMLSSMEQLQQEITGDHRINVKAFQKAHTLHPLVDLAKQALDSRQFTYYAGGSFQMYRTGSDNIEIKALTPSVITRLCRFLSLLFKALEARGHSVEVDHHGTYIVIKQERLKVVAREKMQQVASKEPRSTYDYKATNIAAFQLEGFNLKEWTDKNESLDDQLFKIMARLELQAQLDHKARLEREANWQKQAEEKEAREAPQKRREQELKDLKKLLAIANRWKQAQVLREFLGSTEKDATISAFPDKGKEWLQWAEGKADWYDPFIESYDELLASVDRDTLE